MRAHYVFAKSRWGSLQPLCLALAGATIKMAHIAATRGPSLPLLFILAAFSLPNIVTGAGGERRQIRYLDADNGSDVPACLDDPSTVACQNIYYALLGPRQPISNLELRIGPGTYYYSNETDGGLFLHNATNVALLGQGPRVVLRCREYIDDVERYDNLAFFGGRNVEMAGLTVENCGAPPAGIYVESVEEISLTNCTFRYKELN